jgi:hypothetical protein
MSARPFRQRGMNRSAGVGFSLILACRSLRASGSSMPHPVSDACEFVPAMILAWAYIEGIVAFSSAAPSIFNRYTLTGKLHTVFSENQFKSAEARKTFRLLNQSPSLPRPPSGTF